MAGSGCPLIEARDRRRRGGGASELSSSSANRASSSRGGSVRLRGARPAAVSGSPASADDGGDDSESQSRRESDARMVAAVWNGGRTQLSELRALQRRKRKHEVIEQLTGGKKARAAVGTATAAASNTAKSADVLRALFMQEALMSVIAPR